MNVNLSGVACDGGSGAVGLGLTARRPIIAVMVDKSVFYDGFGVALWAVVNQDMVYECWGLSQKFKILGSVCQKAWIRIGKNRPV